MSGGKRKDCIIKQDKRCDVNLNSRYVNLTTIDSVTAPVDFMKLGKMKTKKKEIL